MRTVRFDKREYKVPECWNELSEKQLLTVSELLHTYMPKKAQQIRMLFALLNVSNSFRLSFLFWWSNFEPLARFLRIPYVSYDDKLFLLELTEFLFEKSDLTKNHLRQIRMFRNGLNTRTLYGPRDHLHGCIFYEFMLADGAYLDFRRNIQDAKKREAALNMLMAVLYRPKRKDLDTNRHFDFREPFNRQLKDVLARDVIPKLPLAHKLATMLYFAGCKQEMEAQYTYVFKSKPDEGDSPEPSGNPWGKALRSMAGSAVNYEQYLNVPLAAALSELDDKIRMYEEAELNKK